MKKYTTLVTFILASLFASAQSFSLLDAQDTVYYDPAEGFKDALGYIQNTSSSSISVDLVRVVNDTAPNHESNFCWGPLCYDADVDFSQIAVDIAPGAVDSTFKITLTHFGNPGVSTVEMRWVNTADRSDTIRQSFTFLPDPAASRDSELKAMGYDIAIAGENPVQDQLHLDVAVPAGTQATLVLLDLQGKVLKAQPVQQRGVVTMPVSGLAPGIYLARLEADGRALRAVKIMKH